MAFAQGAQTMAAINPIGSEFVFDKPEKMTNRPRQEKELHQV